MKCIELTQNKVALVDDVDFERVSQYKWTYMRNPKSCTEYAYRRSRNGTMYLHRFILSAPPDKQVDHRNGNGLDCQRHNLRICNSLQNHQNRRKIAPKSSIYKGVSWHKATSKWRVQIRHDGKLKHLGYFSNEYEAAEVYDLAAIDYFGEFASLNF